MVPAMYCQERRAGQGVQSAVGKFSHLRHTRLTGQHIVCMNDMSVLATSRMGVHDDTVHECLLQLCRSFEPRSPSWVL
jgi:hypothetical protein